MDVSNFYLYICSYFYYPFPQNANIDIVILTAAVRRQSCAV